MAIIFVGAVTFSSCEKHELQTAPEEQENDTTLKKIQIAVENVSNIAELPKIEVINGVLKFNTPEEFFKTLKIIEDCSDEQLDEWEKNLGFTSLRSKLNKMYNELNEADESTLPKLLKEYSDYFYLEDGIIETYYPDRTLNAITNENNIYYDADNTTYKFDKEYLTVIATNKKQTVLKYIETTKGKSATGDEKWGYDYETHRAVRFRFYSIIYHYDNYYKVGIKFVMNGYKIKHNGTLRAYKTNLMFNIFKLDGIKQSDQLWIPFTIRNEFYNSNKDLKKYEISKYVGYYNYYPQFPKIVYIHSKFKSRGTRFWTYMKRSY